MAFKNYIRYVFVIAFLGFILNRFLIRPWVLSNDLPEAFDVLVYSLPNFIEAVMGTILLAGIGLLLRSRLGERLRGLKDNHVYLTATITAGFYVLLQEFGVHNLGGNNVFDPFDVAASILGLILAFLMLKRFGLAAGY